MFSQPIATGSSSASCQEESKDKELQSSEGGRILQLCRVLSSGAGSGGGVPPPLLGIVNVLGDYFSAFHQTFGGFDSLLNTHTEAGMYSLKAILFLMQSVCPA